MQGNTDSAPAFDIFKQVELREMHAIYYIMGHIR